MSEPEVNYDARFVATKATPQGDGYALSGTKLFVPYAHVADKIITVARTSGAPGDEIGSDRIIVDAKASGVTETQLINIAADKLSEVVLDGVPVSSSDVLGKVDEGLDVVQSILMKSAAIRCAEMVGGAQAEIEITAEYTKNSTSLIAQSALFRRFSTNWPICLLMLMAHAGLPIRRYGG